MTPAQRRAAILAATVAATLAFPAAGAAHPGAKIVTVTDGGYEPAYATVYPSQAVHWTWETLGSRSVTADPGQAETFDSDPHSSGFTFEHVFRTPGRYTYRSTEGAPGIGIIEVLPYPTPAPKIKRLRVVGGSKPKAKFRMNVRGAGVGRIEAREGGGWRTVKTFFKRVSEGRNRFRVPGSSLDPGRHRLTLRVYDRFNRLDSERDAFQLEG